MGKTVQSTLPYKYIIQPFVMWMQNCRIVTDCFLYVKYTFKKTLNSLASKNWEPYTDSLEKLESRTCSFKKDDEPCSIWQGLWAAAQERKLIEHLLSPFSVPSQAPSLGWNVLMTMGSGAVPQSIRKSTPPQRLHKSSPLQCFKLGT